MSAATLRAHVRTSGSDNVHITEGYLPLRHAVAWTFVSVPFVIHGVRRLTRLMRERPEAKLLLGVSGGFVFVLSALKLPSVTGSSSHPTAVGLGSILLGPSTMSVLGFVVLLFQALLLAHGGLTTLGANGFAMAIVGSYVAFGVYRTGRNLGVPVSWTVFFAATIADLMTYVVTSVQLALAFPDPMSGTLGALRRFLVLFALTQVPIALTEGVLSVLVMNLLRSHAGELIERVLHREETVGR